MTYFLISAILAIWVFFNARGNENRSFWIVLVLLLNIFGLMIYLIGTNVKKRIDKENMELEERKNAKDDRLFYAQGVNGQIYIYENKVVIERKGPIGFLTHGFDGQKSIPLYNITAIQFKPCKAITRGYLQFSIMGGQEAQGGLGQAVHDENTIMFAIDSQQDFEKIRDFIDNYLSNKHDHAKSNIPSQSDYLNELEKLSELKDKGIISKDDFESKKKQLLGLS